MAFSIKFNEEKNQLLKVTRGISFEEIRDAVKRDGLLADISHPNKRYPHQRVFIVNIKNYAYGVPYVIDKKKQEIFLKTIYASRIFTKIYLKGGKNEKNKKV